MDSTDELATSSGYPLETSNGEVVTSKSLTAAPSYSDPQFWESRFEESDDMFDWYATYHELESIFQEFCAPKADIDVLVVGCGDSALSSELHQAGFRRIVNIDIASAAVTKMEAQFKDLQMEWRVMDATAMTFSDASFDLVIDKGTLDAMMSGGNCEGATAMSGEIWRTMRLGGLFLVVSHSASRHVLLDAGAQAVRSALRTRDVLQDSPCVETEDSLAWEGLELRKTRLSPQATLINILRSKLQGRPMSHVLGDPGMLKDAALEAKKELKDMACIEAFRLFKARREKQAQASNGATSRRGRLLQIPARDVQEDESGEDVDDAAPSQKQPFCWTYVLRKT